MKKALILVTLSALPFAGFADGAKTISAAHGMETVSIPANPQRVVVLDYGSLDTLDALGVGIKLGVPKNNLPSYLSKYRANEYLNIGGLKEFNLETINAFKPELIIISTRQQDYYKQLSAIAPVYMVNNLAQDQIAEAKKNIALLAEIFNVGQKAQEALKNIDEAIARTNEKARAGAKKALVLLTNDGKISAYGSGSRFGMVHDALGLLQADSSIKVGRHGQLVNYEYVAKVNPDIIFVIDRSAAIGVRAKGTRVLDNALVNKTNAAKNGAIVMLDPECWYLSGGGIQSLTKMISEVEAACTRK